MAITVAEFHTALDACKAAILLADWATARTQYTIAVVTHAGLEERVGQNNAYVQRRESLASVGAALDEAERVVTRASDRKRFIRTRTGYQS